MTYTIAHIVDGFGHSANIFGCNMNEYRHMTYRRHIEFIFAHGIILQTTLHSIVLKSVIINLHTNYWVHAAVISHIFH